MTVDDFRYMNRVLLFLPESAVSRWNSIYPRYVDEGMELAEAQWKAFRFMVDDIDRFEAANPDKPIPYRTPMGSELEWWDYWGTDKPCEVLDGRMYDRYQFHIESADWWQSYLARCREHEESLSTPANIGTAPDLELKSAKTGPVNSKPKRESKPKADAKPASKKPSKKHDPGVGSLFG